MDDSRVVFSRARASRLTGLSPRQLDYWRSTLLVTPTTDAQASPGRSIRLYSFTDMVALVTIAHLLQRDVPLRRVRRVVSALKRSGVSNPLVELSFGVVRTPGGKGPQQVRMTARYADGSLDLDDALGQPVLGDEVLVDLEEVRATLRDSRRRDAATIGTVERRRNALGSKPLVAGTRIPVATVQQYFAAEVPDEEILEAFPALVAGDLQALRVAT